jgi:hypothetical protein
MMAYVWYNLAASQGSEDAGTERDKLSRLLTGPEVAQAEALSRDWRPKEVLETPSLRALFNEQLQQLIASAETKAGFAWAQTTKRTTTPNRDIEAVWETEVRFPGASSKPCDVTVVSQAAREAAETFAAKVGRRPNGTSPWISCVVFSSEDSVRAAQFFTMLSQQLWDLVPEDWLRPPPLRGVQSFESVSYSAPRYLPVIQKRCAWPAVEHYANDKPGAWVRRLRVGVQAFSRGKRTTASNGPPLQTLDSGRD